MAKVGQSAKQGTPAMKEAWRLIDIGDVKAARRAAQSVLASGPSAEEATEAQDLLGRTAFPREALKVAALAATLIAVLLIVAILRG